MDVFSAVTTGPSRAHLRAAAIQAAQKLGLFDRLTEESRSIEELAWHLGIESEHRLQALLDVLALEGLLATGTAGEDTSYALHALVEPGAKLPPLGWGQLAQVIRRDAPLEEPGVSGVSSGGEALKRFHDHLRTAGSAAAAELMTPLARSEGGALLDLGSGAGAYSKAWLDAREEVRAILLDRREVLALAADALHTNHRDTNHLRVELIARELLAPEPWPAANVVLLANLLHLFGPEDSQTLVTRAAAACAPGGLVMIKDLRLDDDHSGPAPGVLFSLNMALFTEQGRVHTQGALVAFLRAAGLEKIELRELASATEAIVAQGRKPQALEEILHEPR